ncbi:gephyrin-like molybdotransferase receptor GlpR [Streptomyces asiaticus]|uniref:divisome protein SepX/GlpR n=1 Tax=Streptomyces asiaticus TaxID=114695 RepID=UPI0038256DAD
MASCGPLYRVSVSSSGLIYAVIVGAWAAYLVPMWLRRQDELNEARPTERFSTAIRLLSGRAGMERRYAKSRVDLERPGDPADGPAERTAGDADAPATGGGPAEPGRYAADPEAVTDAVDVRAFAEPVTLRAPAPAGADAPAEGASAPAAGGAGGARGAGAGGTSGARAPGAGGASGARGAVGGGWSALDRGRRARVLARRRRTTVILFVAFTLGAIVAAVGGLAFLWAPGIPAILLSAYIAYLRAQERRRFAFTMDQRHAEQAAQRLRERRRPRAHPPADVPSAEDRPADPPAPAEAEPAPAKAPSPHAAGRRALVEQTDHAEWVDQERERERGPAAGEGWEPVPVPLPTYVTAPVAPRATGSVDLAAPDAWSSARSSTVDPASAHDPAPAPDPVAAPPHGTRDRGRTPLFDQYADEDRPRAANE